MDQSSHLVQVGSNSFSLRNFKLVFKCDRIQPGKPELVWMYSRIGGCCFFSQDVCIRVRASQGHLRPGILNLNSTFATYVIWNIGTFIFSKVKLPSKNDGVKECLPCSTDVRIKWVKLCEIIIVSCGQYFCNTVNKIENTILYDK